jgi:small-conductance mechanosensitive channel
MSLRLFEEMKAAVIHTSFEEYSIIIFSLIIAAIGFFLARRQIPRIKHSVIPVRMMVRTIPFIAPLLVGLVVLVGEFVLENNKTGIVLLPTLQKIAVSWLAAELAFLLFKRRFAFLVTLCAVIPVTLLHLLGWWQPFTEFLDRITFSIGGLELTLGHILSSGVTIVFLLWFSGVMLSFVELRIKRMSSLRASSRSLIAKTVQVAIYIVIALMILDTLEIDLTTLAVFSGALGVGLGFGLQKIASNFISGIILLFEKSIEAGDMIELSDGTTGIIKETGARYTLLETGDNREVFIPNEELISQRVVNLTFTNTQARIEVLVGVSYNTDIVKARELILEAAKSHPRCMVDPEPSCFLRGFGTSSVDFTLHFWVQDVRDGRFSAQSDVMFAIWAAFKKHGIEMPFPQQDVHIKEPILVKSV